MNLHKENQAEKLGRLLKSKARDSVSPEKSKQEREALLARISHERRGAQSSLPASKVLSFPKMAGVGLAVAAAFFGAVYVSEGQLTDDDNYVVLAPEGVSTSTLEAAEQAVDTRFSDGSTLHLEPGGRAQIRAFSDKTAAVVELGRLEVATKAGKGLKELLAGPFSVTSENTVQSVSWDPVANQFELLVTEGRAKVLTQTGMSVYVEQGQKFSADVTAGTHSVSKAVSPPEPTISGRKDQDVGSASERPVPAVKGNLGLRKMVAAGQFSEAVAAVRKYGVANCLQNCDSSDLRSLADAARYSGERTLAEQSLKALSARGGDSSVEFLLGRHYETDSAAQALSYYNKYLQLAPSGSYASEALAGRMRTLQAIGQLSAAKSAARRYLQQYPNGVHTARATALLQTQ